VNVNYIEAKGLFEFRLRVVKPQLDKVGWQVMC